MVKLPALLARSLLSFALSAVPVAAGSANDEPLPRIADRLCPGIMGLATQSALIILGRIRANAERVGVRLADPDTCAPNLLIAFVDNPQMSLDALMVSQPRLFDSLTVREKRELLDMAGPVRAWNIVATNTRDGMSVSQREGLIQIPQAAMWSAHSKIYTATRRDIVSTVVLYDGGQLHGTTLAQLADYASMRAFAADYSAFPEANGDSILTLFGGGKPAELTASDLAFLDTLYSGIPNVPGLAKERQIKRRGGG